MKVVKFEGVNGPYKNEQSFKRATVNSWKKSNFNHTFFEIENGEITPGMPDVLDISPSGIAFFHEFKISDKNGYIKFQRTQPLFYRQYPDLNVSVLAWDIRHNHVVHIEPDEIVKAKSLRMKLL